MKQGHLKVITLAIVIVTTILVGVKTHTKQTMEQMSETMLQNIEALASGEGEQIVVTIVKNGVELLEEALHVTVPDIVENARTIANTTASHRH